MNNTPTLTEEEVKMIEAEACSRAIFDNPDFSEGATWGILYERTRTAAIIEDLKKRLEEAETRNAAYEAIIRKTIPSNQQ